MRQLNYAVVMISFNGPSSFMSCRSWSPPKICIGWKFASNTYWRMYSYRATPFRILELCDDLKSYQHKNKYRVTSSILSHTNIVTVCHCNFSLVNSTCLSICLSLFTPLSLYIYIYIEREGFDLRSSHTKDSKMLLAAFLLNSIIKYESRVNWGNPGRGEAPFPASQLSSYWKGNLQVILDYGRQLPHHIYIYICMYIGSISSVIEISLNIIKLRVQELLLKSTLIYIGNFS